jgi:chromosome segregation ATPase
MTIEEKLAAAEALVASASAERDDLRATVEKLTVGASAEVDSLKVEASAKDAKLVELEGLLSASAKQVEELTAKVAELSAVQVSASAEAAAIVAKVGVAAVDLPQGDSPVRASDKEIAEQYAAMPFGKERTEFLKKNRAAIFSASK